MRGTGTAANRILPVDDDRETGGFFQAAKEHRLVVKGCDGCGAVLHLPRAYCYHCGSWDTSWHDVEGGGTLYAWTVVERPFHPAYETRTRWCWSTWTARLASAWPATWPGGPTSGPVSRWSSGGTTLPRESCSRTGERRRVDGIRRGRITNSS